MNYVKYDDGDEEDLQDSEIDKEVTNWMEGPGSAVETGVDGPVNKKARRKDCPNVKQENSEKEVIEILDDEVIEILDDDSVPDRVVSSTVAGGGVAVGDAVGTTVKIKNEGNPPVPVTPTSSPLASAPGDPVSSSNVTAMPDNPVSSAEIHRAVLSTANEDTKVKVEGSASSLTTEERQKRQHCFDKWQTANTDPRTNKGRFVFRRGCHPQCITKVLGGSGMDPWPVVKTPPEIGGGVNGEANPFIQPGEFYVAGDEVWNPFGPRFPGDCGLVNSWAFDGNKEQKQFHLFIQCADQPHKRLWHGKLAAGGRMYVGVYKVPDEDDPVMNVEFSKDEHISFENKKGIAEFFVKRNYKQFEGRLDPDIDEMHVQIGRTLCDVEWGSASQAVKDMWTMMAYLIDTNYTQRVVPVQFVRFDEELYQTLVDYDCATSKKDKRGRVELNAAALHQYY